MSYERKWTSAVKKFHKKYKVPILTVPTCPDERRVKLREALILEEVGELFDAMMEKDVVAVADGLADLIYVSIGTALEYGIDIHAVFHEVHRSNMTKDGGVGIRGKVEKRKVVKGRKGKKAKKSKYEPPRIAEILYKQERQNG